MELELTRIATLHALHELLKVDVVGNSHGRKVSQQQHVGQFSDMRSVVQR
jgi:hypothetical protein